MSGLYQQKQYVALYRNRLNRHPSVRVNLYNNNNVQVDSLEGITLDGNINISADSTNRRNGSLTMKLDKTLLPKPENKIWFNKRIGIEIGLLDYNDSVVSYDMGKFLMDEPNLSKSNVEKSIQITLKDYMAMWDGTLGGNLSHEMFIIPQSVAVEQAIISIVQSLSKYSVDGMEVDGSKLLVPKEIRRNPNSTIYDALKDIVELYMGYEMYFDTKGYFRVHKIKDKRFDPIVWDFTEDNMDLAIDSTNAFKFNNVKNSIYVWGRKKDDSSQIKWVYRNRWSRDNYSDLAKLSDKQKGDICFLKNENKSYMWDGSGWKMLDFIVVPNFNIENIGEKILAYNEDNIFDELQAKLRCEFELTNQSNFAEEIKFNCIPVYLLDVNKKIKIKDNDIGINGDYLITSISHPLGFEGVSSIQAKKIYY